MQSIPSDVLDELFDLIEGKRQCSAAPRVERKPLTDNELAISLFPECREWLEENHRYDHTPEMYISVYFNRTNDLEYQYRMVRYMELRPTEANKNIVNAWYKELRKKRSNSFDNKPILPGVPDYPVFGSCT